MKLVTLTPGEFDDFAKYHPLNNYQQSSKYARLMTNHGYDYDLIGLKDDNGQIVYKAVHDGDDVYDESIGSLYSYDKGEYS